MPWTPKDANKKTKKADTPKEQKEWSKTANKVLKSTGSDATAIKVANALIKRTSKD
jgi:hypothetical protein